MKRFDVAVIGCGPVGGTAANLLGRLGLSVAVLEKDADPYPLPRAVHIDHEVVRIFQAAGLIRDVLPRMRDTQGHLHIGADGDVIRYLGNAGRPKPYGWASDYFFYQPELEQILRAGLARFPKVCLHLGAEFQRLEQSAEGALIEYSTAHGADRLQARYVIACDGAASAVRKHLQIPLEDLRFEEPWLVVDAEVDGPLQFPNYASLPEGADLQQLSVMLCDPARPTTVVPGRGNHRRWEFMLLPDDDEEEMRCPDAVEKLIAPWVGELQHKVIRAATYRFHGLVATRWNQENVFLAGDAAHQTPPFFGQGMCHGIRDVANLAWKLDLAVKGRVSPAILDEYQKEREPQVRSVIAAAIEAGRYICMLDPVAAAERDRSIRDREASRTVQTAGDLIVPIGGLVREGSSGAGERFIQPIVGDKAGTLRLLDEATGGGFVVLLDSNASNELSAEHVRKFDRLGGKVVTFSRFPGEGLIHDARGDLDKWLRQREAVAVLVRPDFYVFGTAASHSDVDGLLCSLLASVETKDSYNLSAAETAA